MKKVILILSGCFLCLLFATGCSKEDEKNTHTDLRNTKWKLVKSQDIAEIAPQIYLQELKDYVICFYENEKFGFPNSCNFYGGNYIVQTDNFISFSYSNILTELGCLPLEFMNWEYLMYQSLKTATHFTIEENNLAIYCEERTLFFEKVEYDVKQVVISNEDIFQYTIGYFGDEEGAVIQQQTTHHEISKLEREGSDKLVYTYKPQEGFVGKDYLEIRTEKGSDGASPNNIIEVIKIHINVVEGIVVIVDE